VPDFAVDHSAAPYRWGLAASLCPVLETILRRRSIRFGFDDRPVPEEAVQQIVSCALAAPSSKNAQPWRVHVVADRRTLSDLADAVQTAKDADRYVPIDPETGHARPDWPSTVAESAEVLRSVPLGLFVENRGAFSHGRRTVARAEDGIRENALVGYGFEMIGIGAAIQSMWIAAETLGLHGVFMGDVQIAETTIRERLGMAGDAVGVLALGYTSGSPTPKRLAEDRVVHHAPRSSS
jgi:nitroreductase